MSDLETSIFLPHLGEPSTETNGEGQSASTRLELLQPHLSAVATNAHNLGIDLREFAADAKKVGPNFPIVRDDIWSGTVFGGRGDRIGEALRVRLSSDSGHKLAIERGTSVVRGGTNYRLDFLLRDALPIADNAWRTTIVTARYNMGTWSLPDYKNVRIKVTTTRNGDTVVDSGESNQYENAEEYLDHLSEDLKKLEGFKRRV